MRATGSATGARHKLLVVTTHPIQYAAPWFRELASRVDLDVHVAFFRELNSVDQGAGFGQAFVWDMPLLEGYSSSFLNLGAGLRNLIRGFTAIRKLIRKERSQCVLVTGWNEPLLICAQIAVRFTRAKLIVRGDSNALRDRAWLVRAAHYLLLKIAHAFVVVGKSNRDFYMSNRVSSDRIFCGAHFVENERMLAMKLRFDDQRTALRKAYGFAPDENVALFSGKHVRFKRPELLLRAVAKLKDRGKAVSVLYAGSGELTGALQTEAGRIGVRTAFTGFLNQTELWKAYLASDFFVLPSTDQETWGLVVNEAMLFGLPVVVSDRVGCAQDLVIEGETGFTFADGESGLADAISRLLDMKAKWTEMGQRAQAHVASNYSSTIATRGLLEAMDSVCP